MVKYSYSGGRTVGPIQSDRKVQAAEGRVRGVSRDGKQDSSLELFCEPLVPKV